MFGTSEFLNSPFLFLSALTLGVKVQKSSHSTVTDLARLRGWSTSVPLATAVW